MIPGARPYLAPSGPHWIKNARPYQEQVDGRGVTWAVTKVSQGGRAIHWVSVPEGSVPLVAVTVCTESHPDYPSDQDVVEWGRAQKRAAAARGYYP
jgi:hypothetical protein